MSYVIFNVEQGKGEEEKNFLVQYARVDLEPLEARISEIEFEEELPGYKNYYLAHFPQGILFVRCYKKVRIKNIYEGIDWIWRFDGTILHHGFEISPEADPSKIKLKVRYEDLELERGGKGLLLKTPLGSIR